MWFLARLQRCVCTASTPHCTDTADMLSRSTMKYLWLYSTTRNTFSECSTARQQAVHWGCNRVESVFGWSVFLGMTTCDQDVRGQKITWFPHRINKREAKPHAEEPFPVCTVQVWQSGLSFQLIPVFLGLNQSEIIGYSQCRMSHSIACLRFSIIAFFSEWGESLGEEFTFFPVTERVWWSIKSQQVNPWP